MAIEVKRRRGSSFNHSTFTGAEAEITIDTTKKTAVVHDGVTTGGFPLIKENLSNLSIGGLLSKSGGTLSISNDIYDEFVPQSRTLQFTTDSALSFDTETAINLSQNRSWFLSIEDAGISQRGVVNTATQSFSGEKTFTDDLNASSDFYVDGTAFIDRAEIDTLSTTLFKPNSISGMGGEFIFNGTTKVVSIDTTAKTIVTEDPVFSDGDAIVVSSQIAVSGFTKTRLAIDSSGSSVPNGTQYSYIVDATSSGSDTDIESGFTAIKVNENLIYINANEGETNAPFIEGYSNISGFNLLEGSATPNWYIRNNEMAVGDVFSANGSDNTGSLSGFSFDSSRLESIYDVSSTEKYRSRFGAASSDVRVIDVKGFNPSTQEYDQNIFYVTREGFLYAENGTFGGELNAVTGSFDDVDVDGILTMGASGEITNSGADYVLDESGFRFFAPDNTPTSESSLTWIKDISGTPTTVAEISATYGTGGNTNEMILKAGTIEFQDASGNFMGGFGNYTQPFFVNIPALFDKWLQLGRYTTTNRDNINTALLLSGAVIYNTTEDRPQYYNGSSWQNF